VKIYHDFDHVEEIKNAVVTTGSFDGVHLGHKVILERLKMLASETGGETVLITFHPHPRKVLYPETAGKELLLINSQREKIELLRRAGLDNLIIVTFTREFSCITSLEFVRDILMARLHARKIVIGFNHHFGHNREGDYDALRSLGQKLRFEVEEIPEQDIQNESVSSTKIRKALQEGNIQKANAYLDHFYMIIGPAGTGTHDLGDLGFHSFRTLIEEECKLVPPNGVYAVTALADGFTSRGMCFIRKNEGNPIETLVITHLFDAPPPEAGVYVTLLFHKRIREERRFESQVSLQQQLQYDKAAIDELIF